VAPVELGASAGLAELVAGSVNLDARIAKSSGAN
jgi:hypothetical protein